MHIFPVYWHGDFPDRHYKVVFPVYWDGADKDSSYFHLWPLFGSNQRQGYAEYSTVYPFFRYGSDPASGDMDLNAPWPVFNISRRDGYLTHRLLPLYWYEKGADYSGGFLFPYFWRTTPDLTSRVLPPLWYSSRKADQQTDLVLPFYFNHKTPSERLRFITPLYGSRQTGESSLKTLIPLYVNYQRQDFGFEVGLPVLYRYHSGPFAFSSLFPVYYHSEDASERSAFTYYFPLYGAYRRGETVSRRFLLFPLYAKRDDEELGLAAWDVVWPLFHYETSPDSLAMRLLPLYWHSRRSEYNLTVAFPLYWSLASGEDRYNHLLPFYGVHTKGDWYTKRFVLGPVFMTTRDSRTNRSQQDFLYPIASRLHEDGRKRSWCFPFYYNRCDSDTELTLASAALLPPYYINNIQVEKEVFHVWPFYGSLKRGAYREYSTLWPLVRFGGDPQAESAMTHVLLYYKEKRRDYGFTSVLPLWWHETAPETTHDASLFLHWYEHNSKDRTTRFSFLWLLPDEFSLVSYQRGPQRLRHAFFPLYSYDRDDQKDELRWRLLWPLFKHNRQGEHVRQTSFLWKVVSYERRDESTREFLFLWRFIRSVKTASSSVFELNPIYYREKEEGKGSYWAVLGGLLGAETTPEGRRRMRFLWFL